MKIRRNSLKRFFPDAPDPNRFWEGPIIRDEKEHAEYEDLLDAADEYESLHLAEQNPWIERPYRLNGGVVGDEEDDADDYIICVLEQGEGRLLCVKLPWWQTREFRRK